MSSSEFWTMWSALATTIGAIATFCAVVVALWQSHLQYRNHLEVKLQFGQTSQKTNYYLTFPSWPPKNAKISLDGQYFLSVIVSNRGNRKVILDRFSWKYKDGSTSYIPNQVCRIITNGKDISFPCELPVNSSIDIQCPIKYVKSILQNAIKENLVTNKEKIKVFVEDSLGDIFYAKNKLDVNKFV